jgi:probable rRNA maturation factor
MPKQKLALSVQFAVKPDDAPTRPQIRRWTQAALEREAQITVRLVAEEEGRTLNRDYRSKDYATNVLTFVYDEDSALSGDIVLCVPVVSREAAEQNKTVEAHYAHLVVHGVLHLQGHDHENDADAQEMEARETQILEKLGYDNPYAEH